MKTKEKETTGKTNDETTSGKTTDQSTSTNSKRKNNERSEKSVAVKTNVKEVAALIESLDKQLAANPKLETVNKLGKQINEKWDVIEKELEASHPAEYKTIRQLKRGIHALSPNCFILGWVVLLTLSDHPLFFH